MAKIWEVADMRHRYPFKRGVLKSRIARARDEVTVQGLIILLRAVADSRGQDRVKELHAQLLSEAEDTLRKAA